MKNTYVLALITAIFFCQASSCDDPDPLTTSPEELAEQIRRNTPTELPPITTSGENTMGAWIHPQPGSPLHDLAGDSILFVASGVDRPETALATSLDCEAFNNTRRESADVISVSGTYCSRPEIDDDRQMSYGLRRIGTDSFEFTFIYFSFLGDRGFNYWTRAFASSQIDCSILNDDRQNQIFSGEFSGRLINRNAPFDTLRITAGRFDVTYGVTP